MAGFQPSTGSSWESYLCPPSPQVTFTRNTARVLNCHVSGFLLRGIDGILTMISQFYAGTRYQFMSFLEQHKRVLLCLLDHLDLSWTNVVWIFGCLSPLSSIQPSGYSFGKPLCWDTFCLALEREVPWGLFFFEGATFRKMPCRVLVEILYHRISTYDRNLSETIVLALLKRKVKLSLYGFEWVWQRF